MDYETVAAVLYDSLRYLTSRAEELLESCRIVADDGTILYTPDTSGHYRALWTRDWAYMVEYAGDLIPRDHTDACIAYILRGQRADGTIPDRVRADGLAVYVAGPEDRPMGLPNLDNAPFLVRAIDAHLHMLSSTDRIDRLRVWVPHLDRGMSTIPLSARGLVENDQQTTHSPYGFTDTIRKTGELFMESLLYWRACRTLAWWHETLGQAAQSADYVHRSRLIEQNVGLLWDHQHGAFLAATLDCRQLDIWANAFALYMDFPLNSRRQQMTTFLARHYEQFVWHGQVRHLLRGEYWQRTFIDVAPDTYQNGGYWATASGWVYGALLQPEPVRAQCMLTDLVADFRHGGMCEWISDTQRALPGYVASVVNIRAALLRQLA